MGSGIREKLVFLSEFVRSPSTVGAIAPSSAGLAREIVAQASFAADATVMEFGPGTGVFTGEIIRQLGPGGRFVAIERNAQLVPILQERFPDAVICEDSIGNAGKILERHGIGQVHSIVCGLPWAAFDEATQDDFLETTHASLKDGGIFVTFAYLQGLLLPAGQRFKKKITARFSEVRKSRVVWRNLPPAFVYRCRK